MKIVYLCQSYYTNIENCMNRTILQLQNIRQELCKKHRQTDSESAEDSCAGDILSAADRLRNADVVVAGGYGVGSAENFKLLYKLAEVLHAEVGATRAAIDAGFCADGIMIGSTGLTVHPRLYVACGISGARQHTSGIKDCDRLVSINIDAEAPINQLADKVIVDRVEDVLPTLISSPQTLTDENL